MKHIRQHPAFLRFAPAFLVLLLAGCPLEGDDATLINGEYVLEIEYVNITSGYENSGRFINSAGEVWYYEAPAGYGQSLQDLDLTVGIPVATLQLKYSQSIMVNVVTLPNPLERLSLLDESYSAQIAAVAPDTVDGGVYTIRGYLYDKRHDTYRDIVLVQCGDVGARNQAAAADVLLDLLSRQISLPCVTE